MGSEKFCLRWNDFETNISSAFRELREDKDFFDVTLACDDEQIQAHKVILSACSPFFRNILRRNPHQHPLLYLKGVKYTDIQAVLNFMYHGEVNVAQEELNSFLAVAEDLRVKGLTQNQSEPQTKTISIPKSLPVMKSTTPRAPEREADPPPKRPRPAPPTPLTPSIPSSSLAVDDDIQEYIPVKSEPREPLPQTQQQPQHFYTPPSSHQASHAVTTQDDQDIFQETENYEDYGQYGEDQAYAGRGDISGEGNKVAISGTEDLDGFLNANIIELNPETHMLKCGLCEYTYNRRSNVARHIEAKHVDMQFQCDLCDKITPTRHALYYHKKKHTEYQQNY